VVDSGGAVPLGQGEDAEDAADTGFAIGFVDAPTQGADVLAGPLGTREELLGRLGRARGLVLVADAVATGLLAQVLAQELPGLEVEDADDAAVPLHVDLGTDRAERWCVIGALHLDEAVEVHGASAVLVVAEGLERKGEEVRPLLGKHGGDLPLGGAVDPGVGPLLLPSVEVSLPLVEALEAQSLERRPLGVADTALDLALPIGVADAAGDGGHAVVLEDVPVERVQFRVVDVGLEHALSQVVQDHDARRATDPPEGALVELGPDPGARAESEEADRFSAVAQGEDEEAGAAILAGLGMPHHRTRAVVDLPFLARRRDDDRMGLARERAPQPADEALDAVVVAGEAVVVDEVLPDGHGVAAAGDAELDDLAVGLAGARLGAPPRRSWPRWGWPTFT
jgi:hypothetical protein